MREQDNHRVPELEQFFSEWKEKDKALAIPELNWKRKSRKGILTWLPLGIAACLALAFWLKPSDQTEIEIEKDILIIRLIEDENQEQRFLIETQSSLDVWDASSSSLLTEF